MMIETLYTSLDIRPRPLANVLQFISATRLAFSPLLDDVSDAELSLHLSTLSSSIPNETLLETIPTNTNLTIKSIRDTITVDEYMLLSLPASVYNFALPNASISMPNAKVPRHVIKWSSFEQEVLDWVDTNHEVNSRRLNRPVFVPILIASEVPTLQPFIKLNLLNIAAVSSESVRFTDIREVHTAGEPDFMMTKNGEVVAVIEVAGKWTLGEQNLVENYQSNNFVSGKINQVYHYMRLNHKKYAILTTYDFTWFIFRKRECTDCSAEELAHDTVYVTSGISSSQINPTALQTFAFFATIADTTFVDSPPSSRPMTRATSSSKLPSNSKSKLDTSRLPGSARDLASNNFLDPSETPDEQHFDADNFSLKHSIGEGRCKVFLDEYDGKIIALKVADISKQPAMLKELKNELTVYEVLKELQGSAIPKVFLSGKLESILYCIGMSMCGRVPETLTTIQKRHLLDTLDKIHAKGILHNDIKVQNILVDGSSNPYLIDFGFASQSSSVEAFGLEKRLLIQCIDAL